jgi:hypothetical protein
VIGREAPVGPGQLNFLVTEEVKRYVNRNGLDYHTINDVLGALEGAKQEFYRRVAAPYENRKAQENGDVYAELLNDRGMHGDVIS